MREAGALGYRSLRPRFAGGPRGALRWAMRLLAICTLPPWPIRDGYSLRVAGLLQELASEWDVALLAPGARPPFVAEHTVLALPGTGLSYPWRFDNAPLCDAIAAGLRGRPDRALVWPGAEAAWLAARSDVPAVLDMIDCNPLEFARAAVAGPWRRWGRERARAASQIAVAAWHARRAVRGFGATVCVGEADAAWMARLGGRAVHVVPNGVVVPDGDGVESAAPTVVFAGTLDYAPNLDAVAFLVGSVWPLVKVPGARLVIAGRRPGAAILALHGRDGIEVRADVPDMAAVLRDAWVAVAPLRTGVGLKNKVLEAWACARPVVATPMAMNGLVVPPGHAGLVQADAAGLAAAIAGLLRDGAARARLGQAARDMVAARFTWAGAAARIDALLRQ